MYYVRPGRTYATFSETAAVAFGHPLFASRPRSIYYVVFLGTKTYEQGWAESPPLTVSLGGAAMPRRKFS